MPDPRQRNSDLPDAMERFEFEALEAFQLALEAADAADEIAMRLKADRPWAANQIGRASLSIVANTGEGSGEHSPGDKARFYRYARRSASETGAIIVFLARKTLISLTEELRMRALLLSVIKLLTRLAIRFEGEARARRRGWKPRQR